MSKLVALTLKKAGRQVVVVTHGDVIAFLTLWAESRRISSTTKAKLYKERPAPGSITTFTFPTAMDDELPGAEYQSPETG